MEKAGQVILCPSDIVRLVIYQAFSKIYCYLSLSPGEITD